MSRVATLVFAVLAYAIFLATFLYMIAFVAGLPAIPFSVDEGGPIVDWPIATAIDLGLITIFALQHSVMARPRFKAWWTKFVPKPAERSVYVLSASAALLVLFLAWCPIQSAIWNVSGALAIALWALFALGWLIVLVSTFLINNFELFGLQQAWLNLRNQTAAAPELRRPFFYKFVRHPLYSGFFIAFWATPYMTAGHALLATAMSAFMLIAIQFEERDLIATFGSSYQRYREEVGMLLPLPRRR